MLRTNFINLNLAVEIKLKMTSVCRFQAVHHLPGNSPAVRLTTEAVPAVMAST